MRRTLWVEMRPQPKQRPRLRRDGHVYTPGETEGAEALIRTCWVARYGAIPKGGWAAGAPLRLTVAAYFKRPRTSKRPFPTVKPDLSNLVKLIEDALNGIAYVDDSQICTYGETKKRYCDTEHPSPGVEITIDDDDMSAVAMRKSVPRREGE